MDLLGPIVEIILFLWSPISRQIGYLKNLNHHISTLSREIDELKCMHDEVQAQVDVAVSAGMTRLPRVQKWLEDVGRTVGEVDSIRLELERGRTRCCCVGLNLGRKLGRRAIRKKKEVEILRQKGGFSQVCESPRRSQTPEMQVPQDLQKQSTSKETLKEIWQFLKEDEVGIICVWGMGGIGKSVIDPHLPSPTSAPPRVISKVHLAGAATMVHFSGGFGLFKTHQSGIRAVDRPPPLPEKPLPKSQPLPPPLPSPEKKVTPERGSPKRRLAGVGYLHSSPEKKEHCSSGTPAEHCANFSGTPSLRQRHVIVTSAAQ
ncbi:hypothetical protein ACLOJK_034514 [Asimina triloba]